jgi:hypothetical protein
VPAFGGTYPSASVWGWQCLLTCSAWSDKSRAASTAWKPPRWWRGIRCPRLARRAARPAIDEVHRDMTKAKTPEPTPKSQRLEIIGVPGKTEGRLVADLVAHGVATNASIAVRFVRPQHGELSLTDMVASLHEHGEAVNRGDLSAAERMLNAQAVALNVIFCELAGRAALNMGEHLGAAETYMRLALRAQNQARATVETLAAIKNPPVVFARQANIAHGPQQVNNGTAPNGTPASAHPGETVSKPTELLEDSTDGRTQLDTRATATTGRTNQDMAAVGAVNRAANR